MDRSRTMNRSGSRTMKRRGSHKRNKSMSHALHNNSGVNLPTKQLTRVFTRKSPQHKSPDIFRQRRPKTTKTRKFFSFRAEPNNNLPFTEEDVLVPDGMPANNMNAHKSHVYSKHLALKDMKDHLREFAETHADPTYEEWIHAYLPESVKIGRHGQYIVNYRFYLPDAVSLRYWNNYIKKKRNNANWVHL